MSYAGLQMFMENLKQLINCKDNPLINHPEIIREKLQFQLLHQDLGSMIQTLYIDKHQDLQEHVKLTDLKKRFIHAAEEAQYIVDLFLSGVHIRNNGHLPTSEDFKRSLYLDNVRRSFQSLRVEFMGMRINNMELDSSPRPERTLNQSATAAVPRNSPGLKKIPDDIIIVGLDDDAKLINDKLMEDRKKLDVVSIVGMGGIGKTTLATKVFNDSYVKYHFHVRVWVTISQTYDKRHVLTQILESICGQFDLGDATESRLCELLHKQLIGKRYLIVIDDIWHIETWDNLKLFFPYGNNGSRILLTSRLIEVAKHANSDGLIHHLGCFNKEKGWELLCKKVFHGNDFPEWSIKPGMRIVENCKGLPLAVAVIAGVLAKESLSEKFWGEIAYRTCSNIFGDQNGSIMESLALSYNHLPPHLRECFHYLGGFPEDHILHVQMLIWLWVAEGFIHEDGNRSLEDIAEGYLMDLIDRNLLIVAGRRKSNGGVRTCKVHDLVREISLRKAKEEGYIIKTETQTLSSWFSNVITLPFKLTRMYFNDFLSFSDDFAKPYPSSQNLRSILHFTKFISSDTIANYFISFVLLKVLDMHTCFLKDFPKDMELLVHLRYLAIWKSSTGFPSSICKLWGLQTLIYITNNRNKVVLPSNILNLINLRHLLSYHPSSNFKMLFERYMYLSSIEKPMNLQTFSHVQLGYGVDYKTCFPCIKELSCRISCGYKDFKSFTYLEKLKLDNFVRNALHSQQH
ncbi:hypothetical protein R6Q57_015947 [Mikania cordata]